MDFIKNKYYQLYFDIINRSKCREYDSNLHEKHHIIPISFGGSDSSDNLSVLTFREHFICHWLLTKFCEKNNKYKAKHALAMFRMKNGKRVLTSRQFEIARKTVKKINPETKEKIRLSIIEHNKTKNFSNIIKANKNRAGKKHPTTSCPYCKKIGSVSNMSRWHFNNCKLKVS